MAALGIVASSPAAASPPRIPWLTTSTGTLAGLATLEQSFRDNAVTVLCDTDHRDITIDYYYRDPRFLDAAARTGVKRIVVEIASIIQPLIGQLARKEITLADFTREATKIDTILFTDSSNYFNKLGKFVAEAKIRDIDIVAGNIRHDYPVTAEINQMMDKFIIYADKNLHNNLKNLGLSPPYTNLNPEWVLSNKGFISAYPDLTNLVLKQHVDFRDTKEWNLQVLEHIADAKANHPAEAEKLRIGLDKTIIIFGSGHGEGFSQALTDLGLSYQIVNFEPHAYIYKIHLSGHQLIDLNKKKWPD